MDECFRFFVNVDQCLNMSTYDIFFYKLINERKFRSYQAQGYCADSLQPAFRDIQMYLNKYPYHMKEYQITVAMRCSIGHQTRKWEDTPLYRLMHIAYALHREQISLDAAASTGCALNLFMLCEAPADLSDWEPDAYFSTATKAAARLCSDCELLLAQLGIRNDTCENLQQLEDALTGYQQQGDHDAAAAFFVRDFLDLQPAADRGSLTQQLAQFLRERFQQYQVVELILPRNVRYSPKKNVLARLRLVEFLNQSLEDQPHADKPLIDRCRESWEKVYQNRELELHYSDMLFEYEQRLRYVHQQLEKETVPVPQNSQHLPARFHESLEDICVPNSMFEQKNPQDSRICDLLDGSVSPKVVSGDKEGSWNDTYSKLREILGGLEDDLGRYVECLGLQYSQRVENRKKEALYWKNLLFFADKDTRFAIIDFQKKRDGLLQKLRQPDMMPSLRFEAQEKAETALKQANARICHYVECLKAIRTRRCFGVSGVIIALTLIHYCLLQPIDNIVSLPMTVLYGLVVWAAMALTCWLPSRYYSRAIKKQMVQLKKQLDLYLPEYIGRGQKFRKYVNTLDELDSTNKLLELYSESLETTEGVQRGCLWHKAQLRDHLVKLAAFSGLIDHGTGRERSVAFSVEKYTTGELLTGEGMVKNIEQCSLYWPQGKE